MRMAWSGFLLSLSLCLDLGLVNLAIVRTALQSGGTQAFALGLGSCVGDLVYFGLSVLGVAALLAWPPARWAVWLGGTALLLFLTGKMLREVLHPHDLDLSSSAPPRRPLAGMFGWGISLALASPTGILWFAAIGGSVIAASGGSAASGGTRSQLLPFAAGFFLAGIFWSALLAWAAAFVRRWGGRTVVRTLSLLSALLFLYFAVDIFLRGFRELGTATPPLAP